ncbi:MAG: DUF4835 family protein [Candidatus Limimorpha sp.]
MKRTYLSVLIASLMLIFNISHAQELKFDVRVNASKISGSDRTVFQNLQTALVEFVNNTKWTNINFKTNERIEGSILINVNERTETDNFAGDINIVLRRPVYKTNFNTPVFNYIDTKFSFEYIDGQMLDFNPSTYSSDLTSTIAFYIYLALGMDFDTFSEMGGEEFFKLAEGIANVAPQDPGWDKTKRRNRYAIIENMTNPAFSPIRKFMYEYHRLGLDVMSEKPDEGRAFITKALENLQQVYDKNPSSYLLQLIVETKRNEIIQVYSQGSQQEKTKAVNIMKAIDPSKASDYDAILKGN